MSKKDRLYKARVLVEIEFPMWVPADSTVKRTLDAELTNIMSKFPEGASMAMKKSYAPKKVMDVAGGSHKMAYPRIWTDGGCFPNPGPGGWGVYAEIDGDIIRKCGSGGDETTNNRMELQAAIEGLTLIPEGTYAVLYTDSKYVCTGITEWVHNCLLYTSPSPRD